MPAKSTHGGKRPGAGGKPGNLNALKSGDHSRQVDALRLALQAIPLTADLFKKIDGRQDARVHLLAQVLRHYADLIELQAAGKRSSSEAKNAQEQMQKLFKIAKTVKPSSDVAGAGSLALSGARWPCARGPVCYTHPALDTRRRKPCPSTAICSTRSPNISPPSR